MSDLDKILLTSGLTIIGGIVIFTIGQIINEIVIKPYISYKKTIGKIDEELIFSSNIYMNPGIRDDKTRLKAYREASLRLRRLASNFGATYRSLNLKNFFIKLDKVVKEEDKDKVERSLISLSNALFDEDSIDNNDEASKGIRTILKI